MIFHSLDFLVFFALVVSVYWRLPHRAQNALLLAASYFFYGYVHPWFLILIGSSTLIDYASARGMEQWPARRRLFMAASIASNFGMLGFFKYFNFFVDNLAAALAAGGIHASLPVLRVLLPVGISFYTFQAMSYTIDVFRGELRARRSLLDVAVFISFFPHLVAGPIQRASYLLPQVEAKRRFSLKAAASGFYLMVWGFFKKLVIADNVGVIANKVFALSDPSFEILWAGVFAFAIQIYADFSAYTDIARGSSRWLGFELTENFDHPYMARTPADFWRRWNISLSTWFRDYVYIPLGGSRGSDARWAGNVLVTFLLSGLWHGASWNYVLWGLYHGVLLVLTRGRLSRRSAATGKPQPTHALLQPPAPHGRARVILQAAGMFALSLFGWLLFRETQLSAIARDLRLSPWHSSALDRRVGLYLLLLAFGYSVPLWVQSIWIEWRRRGAPLRTWPSWSAAGVRAIACGAAFAGILVLRSRTSLDFIYFQF
ncbi:MAG TPA: MBOAT family O-acyltransferase [Vicinamibacterales bacterium]|nr:MBOAT family O-acyltransferase [Vicinamibacterales bacterium]